MSSFHDQWMEAFDEVASLRAALEDRGPGQDWAEVNEISKLLSRAGDLIYEENDSADLADGGRLIRHVRRRCRALRETT